jgi:hypothetical protein
MATTLMDCAVNFFTAVIATDYHLTNYMFH